MIKEFSYYDKIIISFSGGKDSISCFLYLLQCGVPKEKIELWHQYIDGYGQQEIPFFDWKSTHGYVTEFAKQFGVRLEGQWRDGGFHREMMREEQLTGDVYFTRSNKIFHLPTTKGAPRTRKKWPAVSGDLNARWCSSYLKIDVAARALANTPELRDKRILFITGERREESAKRSKYKESELHRTNSKSRLVHHWRPIIDFKETEIWQLMEHYKVKPHPVYYLGFPRLSCKRCIFFSPNHWATLYDMNPDEIKEVDKYEQHMNFSLYHKKVKGKNESVPIWSYLEKGNTMITEKNADYVAQALGSFKGSVLADPWELPSGAFGKGGGAS